MSNQSLAQKSVYWLKVISLGLILGLGIQFARAWTPPTAAPPGGNVSGPLTTGNGDQTKVGGDIFLSGAGSLYAGLKVAAPWVCVGSDCRNAWPPGGGDNLGNHTATIDLNMNSKKITNVGSPTIGTDGANKDYVDGKTTMKVFSGIITPGNCLSTFDSSHQLCQNFFTQTVPFPSAFTSAPDVIVSVGAPLDPAGCTGFAGDSFAVIKGSVTKTGFTVSSGYSPLANSACGVEHEGWVAQLSVHWMAIGN